MPLLEGEALRTAYREILDGRRRLIGWGAIGNFPYLCMQSPVLPEYLVDTDAAKAGHQVCGIPIFPTERLMAEDAAGCCVVVYPERVTWVKEIVERLDQLGPFVVIPPFRIEIDGPMLREELEQRAAAGLPSLARIDGEQIEAMLRNWSADQLGPSIAALQATADRDLPPVARGQVRLLIGNLQPGGAERQIVHLAGGLRRAGWSAELLTFGAPSPGCEHYVEDLACAGVPNRILPSAREVFYPENVPSSLPDDMVRITSVLSQLPLEIIHQVAVAYRVFARERPELVICYLDTCNVAGGIAALMAGIPNVLVSGRNINPSHFPNHYSSALRWMRGYYKVLADFPALRLSANSHVGARSYEDWLELPFGAVSTVPNGVTPTAAAPADPAEVARVRAELALPADAPLIVGAFRLAVEKQPLLFVETLRRVAVSRPDMHAAVVGSGPLQPVMEAAVAAAGLQDRVHLVGARPDVRSFLAAGDLLLHTALAEGHPNVVLEAQLLNRPVVCTDAAGTRECLVPWLREHVHATDDAAGLARSCLEVLSDLPTAHGRMETARNWVLDNFSLERLVVNTLAAAGI
ncbi:glycosyltransferase [Azospirillum sp. 11R-A]|uniref:glycosyltransferase n=1 Tax=Azospirillum sp. 11R-A TaxID=3111634 RepID=UPI003C2078C0